MYNQLVGWGGGGREEFPMLSSSVSDPDPESGSGSRRAKMNFKNRKKFRNFMF
jgi:hypothetical protein